MLEIFVRQAEYGGNGRDFRQRPGGRAGGMFGTEHCRPFSIIADIFHCSDRENELSGRPALEGTMKLPFLVITLILSAVVAAQPSEAQNAFTPDQVKYGP